MNEVLNNFKHLKHPKLTERQKLFCVHYLNCFNATKAAELAGFSPKTAYSIGPRLLKNVGIQNFINQLAQELFKTIGLTKDRIWSEIVSMAFGPTSDEKLKLKALTTLLEHFGEESVDSNEIMKRNADRVLAALTKFKNKEQ